MQYADRREHIEGAVRKGLELIVDEAVPGHFYWLVLDRETFGEPRRAIARAPGPYPTHRQAVAAGAAAIRQCMEPAPLLTRAAGRPGLQGGAPAGA